MVKQVIVVRKDLKMRKGKIGAQVAHASMKVFFDRMEKTEEDNFGSLSTVYKGRFTPEMIEWKESLFTKIVVGCDDIHDINHVAHRCEEFDIPYAIIEDAGLTEFHGNKTITCIALGPDNAEKIDEITGGFKLM